MRRQQTPAPRQTPLEKLTSDKLRLQEACRAQAAKLNDDLSYIQENAGSLLLSGLSSLLFPGPKAATKKEGPGPKPSPQPRQSSLALNASDYLSIAKGMIPVAWEVAQPLLMSWGIKKAKKWLAGLFSRKKETTANN